MYTYCKAAWYCPGRRCCDRSLSNTTAASDWTCHSSCSTGGQVCQRGLTVPQRSRSSRGRPCSPFRSGGSSQCMASVPSAGIRPARPAGLPGGDPRRGPRECRRRGRVREACLAPGRKWRYSERRFAHARSGSGLRSREGTLRRQPWGRCPAGPRVSPRVRGS